MKQDEHDLLIRIDERVADIQKQLETINLRCTFHGKRLTRIEGWKNKIIGGIGVLTLVIGIVAEKTWGIFR